MKAADQDRATLAHLGEEAWPVGLHLNTGGLQDGVDLLGGDGDVIVGEDEGGVDTSQLGVRHGGGREFPGGDLARERTICNRERQVYKAASMI